MAKELRPNDLSWQCPEDWLPWSSSAEIEEATTIVAQDRAVEAIAFGLGMRGVGYNVFVTGMSGTGRLTTIKRFLDQLTEDQSAPDDVCFVYNLKCPEEPNALCLHAGAGVRLRDGMDRLVEELSESLPSTLSSQEFRHHLERGVAPLQKQERYELATLESEVREAGFSMVQIQAGPVTKPEILPLVNDEPVAIEELGALVEAEKLSAEEAQRLESQYERFRDRLQEVFLKVADLRRQAQERMLKIRRQLIEPTIDEKVETVRSQVGDPRADGYLNGVADDLLDHMDHFVSDSEDGRESDRFLRWRVNVAVDNSDVRGRPVVIETEPSYSNVFGTIERTLLPSGESVTSFTRIRAGSLLRANGGFLVLNGEDLLWEARAWPSLKRALKYRRVKIQPVESIVLGGAGLKPEEVSLDVKVVVIGDRRLFDMLYRYDSDFPKIFKVLADFDSVMPSTQAHARDLLSVLVKVAKEEDLQPMSRDGMAAVLERAVRFGRWRRRFSSRFSDLSDLMREAAYQAELEGASEIKRKHVDAADAAYRRRHGLSEDRSHEYISEGVIHLLTEGSAVGQVNGLAVYDLGHYRFGKPSRISARVGLGREGVVNVERNAGLSGPTHDKGVQILTGFLRGTFARKVPMNMGCSVTFEQSYGGIDGDSASSTEIYAVLSALSDLPLRQDIAVTGSVDQYGRVQAIGGVNEKVEGFFRVCATRGLTGTQGVMIPTANEGDLHLSADVVNAVGEGRFHVWSVATIEEGVELLSGVAAGQWDVESGWSEDSVYGRCERRLQDMARLIRNAGKDGSDNGDRDNGAAADEGDVPASSSSHDANTQTY